MYMIMCLFFLYFVWSNVYEYDLVKGKFVLILKKFIDLIFFIYECDLIFYIFSIYKIYNGYFNVFENL